MFEDLAYEEKLVLDLFVRQEKDKDFNLQKELKKYTNCDDILVILENSGYINAKISQGAKGDYSISFDYTKNGHILTDYALNCYNLEK